jgi:hypothetical protein
MCIWIPSREYLVSKEDENDSSDGGGVDIPISKDISESLVQLQHHVVEGRHLEGVCNISAKLYEVSKRHAEWGGRKERALNFRAYPQARKRNVLIFNSNTRRG